MLPKICSIPECNKPFLARGWCRMHYKRIMTHGDASFVHPDYLPAEVRFWAKVEKTESCWIWGGHLNHKGYGRFGVDGRLIFAHRFVHELEIGPIPEGLVVDHMCHTRACVNPKHLRLASAKQNVENLSGLLRNNKSGARGVSWNKESKKWVAQVVHNGRVYYLGKFSTVQEADAIAKAKRNELFTHNLLDRVKV